MIQITRIELSEILTNNKLDDEKLLEKINNRIMNLYSNTNEVHTKVVDLRKELLDLDKKINKRVDELLINFKTETSKDIKKIIANNFNDEEE